MQVLIRILTAALLAVGIVIGCWVCIYIETLNRVTADLPLVLDAAIAREGHLTRQAAEQQISDVASKLDTQVTALRSDLFQRVDSIEAMTFALADDLRADMNRQLDSTRDAAIEEIAKLSTPASNTLERISETADLALDCESNPDCAFNRYVGTARAIEKMAVSGQTMMDAIAQETPETAAAIKSTSKDLSVIVARFARPANALKTIGATALRWCSKLLLF